MGVNWEHIVGVESTRNATAQDAEMVAEEMAHQSDAQLAEDAALDLLIAAG